MGAWYDLYCFHHFIFQPFSCTVSPLWWLHRNTFAHFDSLPARCYCFFCCFFWLIFWTGVIVDNLKGDMSELRCRATFWKRRRKVQLEIKRTNANISVSRGKCTIFTRIAFLHFKESCRSVQWGFVQYVKLIFSLFKSGGGADVIVGVQTWRQ